MKPSRRSKLLVYTPRFLVAVVLFGLVGCATAPAPTIRKQSARVVLDRLTTQERAALHTARQSSAELDAFVLKAVSEGTIIEADPEFAAAVTALDAAGIIAANRWAALLA